MTNDDVDRRTYVQVNETDNLPAAHFLRDALRDNSIDAGIEEKYSSNTYLLGVITPTTYRVLVPAESETDALAIIERDDLIEIGPEVPGEGIAGRSTHQRLVIRVAGTFILLAFLLPLVSAIVTNLSD